MTDIRLRYLALCLILSVVAAWHARAQTASADAPQRPFIVPIVEIAGDGREMGLAYGRRLEAPMRELLDRYLMRYISGEPRRTLTLAAARGFIPFIDPQHEAEVTAVAEAARLDVNQVLLAQCFLDLLPMTACSAVSLPGEAFKDGVPRLARNLDFPSLDVADRHTIVAIHRPTGRHAFASVSWPGMLGVLSGMNEHGLVLVNMEVERPGGVPRAMPYTLLYRTVLETCRDVDEAIKLLESTPRQTANNVMLMDAAGNRAVVEITPQKITVRRGQPRRALISTNHQRGTDQSTAGRCDRYDLLARSSSKSFGRMDLGTIRGMLKEVQQGNLTLQSMVFEPSTRTLYLSAGKRAADRELHRLELGPCFDR